MTDIQRYEVLRMDIHPVGRHKPSSVETVVFYADHVEALREAEQRGYMRRAATFIYTQEQFEQGQRDALAGAVQRVEAAQRVSYPEQDFSDDAYIIAAIKGDSDG